MYSKALQGSSKVVHNEHNEFLDEGIINLARKHHEDGRLPAGEDDESIMKLLNVIFQ